MHRRKRNLILCNQLYRPLMQRVTITIDDELMDELDRIIAARGYQNRSEAIRDLAREFSLEQPGSAERP